MPNVNVMEEMVIMIGASRAYEANARPPRVRCGIARWRSGNSHDRPQTHGHERLVRPTSPTFLLRDNLRNRAPPRNSWARSRMRSVPSIRPKAAPARRLKIW
ncbi:MAG: flagellar basal body rod C-terminal domain-containing protein [Nitrospiraceae bacterium]